MCACALYVPSSSVSRYHSSTQYSAPVERPVIGRFRSKYPAYRGKPWPRPTYGPTSPRAGAELKFVNSPQLAVSAGSKPDSTFVKVAAVLPRLVLPRLVLLLGLAPPAADFAAVAFSSQSLRVSASFC